VVAGDRRVGNWAAEALGNLSAPRGPGAGLGVDF